MAEVDIDELRDHLSTYLARVAEGEEIVIIDRRRAVARLMPFTKPRPYDRLVAQGLIERAPATKRRRPRGRVEVGGSVSDLVGEQRR